MPAKPERVARLVRQAMARGVVVLDENVQVLAPALRAANIHVVVPKPGTADEDIKGDLLPHRIFITANTRDFVADASSYGYGIIGLDTLRFIDPSPDLKTNKTVKLISQAITQYRLWSLKWGFLVPVTEEGVGTLITLTD